jgi:hypothetical protein
MVKPQETEEVRMSKKILAVVVGAALAVAAFVGLRKRHHGG